LETFREFRGLEHRLEYVGEINKVKFINDSKSTTVESCLWALKNTPSPIVLIAGGREKGNDYSPIRDLAQQKVKEIVLIGEARQKIGQAFSDILPTEEAQTLEEAVRRAFAKASPGDSVLLSPMCKSFDMFANFEERGRAFKKVVYELTANKS
ncbi:MAG: UDP-N-acetylmuramoyl-L-alanine--D-glutamate ligase, partial [Candidatus Omnitrophica bacterium]|nr:UDP-N-acetylmuramoyl-L-alanine--D-glutamate ligase [Candidatus Omnitrophota bacterium]